MPSRREFLSQASIAGALAVVQPRLSARVHSPDHVTPRKSLCMLILGGTGFIGPHFVRAALDRGHKVSVFTRGKTHAELPVQVERLTGDRNSDLNSIRSRDWDAVLDLATFGPAWIRTLGQAIQGRAKHYTFISTVDVYKDPTGNQNGTDEGSETREYDGPRDPYSLETARGFASYIKELCERDMLASTCLPNLIQEYGALKVLCEKEALQQFPGRTLIVRPGYMVGPGDPQGRFTYWLARMQKGGAILAPGDPLQPVQFIDVRDVAEWVIRMAERGETGAYNTLGPGGSMSMSEMLGGIRSLFGLPTKLTWVAIPWISRQDIVDLDASEWDIWRFSRDDDVKSDKAYAKGLTYRPLSVTATETLAWYKTQPAVVQAGATTNPSRKDDKGEWPYSMTPWNEFLDHEREIIRRWKIHQGRILGVDPHT